MDPWLIWLVAGLLLLGGELLLPGVYLLWAGAAAVGTGLGALALGLGFPGQTLLFLALLAGGIALSLRARRRGGPDANAPGSGLVGRAATVLEAGPGGLRVRLGDSDWPALSPEPLSPGETVCVVGVEGVALRVSRGLSAPPARPRA